MRKIKQWISYVTAVFIFVLVAAGSVTAAETEKLVVHYLNVGQGDATLVTVGEHAMLIDAGGNDDVEPVLNYIQNKQGLDHLEYVVGTHPHEDHIGAMDAVIDAVEVENVLLPDVTTNTQTFEDVLDAIERNNPYLITPEVGETYKLGDASFTILGPAETYDDSDLNNWSIALKITYYDTSFIFTGDAEETAEQDIINTGLDLTADVYQVGHHGSDTSSSESFIRAVVPSYAVISCGSNNDYGHPNQSVLDRLNEFGIQIFRTDIQGTITATSDGNNISWSEEPTSDFIGGDADSVNNEVTTSAIEETQPSTDIASTAVMVHITNTGEKYHSAGCQYLRSSDIEVTLEGAKSRGLTPCSKCNPPQ